jgi:hypothetical protein
MVVAGNKIIIFFVVVVIIAVIFIIGIAAFSFIRGFIPPSGSEHQESVDLVNSLLKNAEFSNVFKANKIRLNGINGYAGSGNGNIYIYVYIDRKANIPDEIIKILVSERSNLGITKKVVLMFCVGLLNEGEVFKEIEIERAHSPTIRETMP